MRGWFAFKSDTFLFHVFPGFPSLDFLDSLPTNFDWMPGYQEVVDSVAGFVDILDTMTAISFDQNCVDTVYDSFDGTGGDIDMEPIQDACGGKLIQFTSQMK